MFVWKYSTLGNPLGYFRIDLSYGWEYFGIILIHLGHFGHPFNSTDITFVPSRFWIHFKYGLAFDLPLTHEWQAILQLTETALIVISQTD